MRSRFRRRGGGRRGKGVAAPLRVPAMPRALSGLKLHKMRRARDWLRLQRDFLQQEERRERRQQSEEAETGAGDERDKLDEKEARRRLVAAFRGSPVLVGTLEEVVGDWHGIVTVGGGQGEWYLRFASIVDKEQVEPGLSVLVQAAGGERGGGSLPGPGLFIVGVLGEEAESMAAALRVDKAPTETFRDVGGLDSVIEALKETVELPLSQPELFEDMGVPPPKGIILYGPPGTGKTLLVKAVANRTQATFLRVTGSELIRRHSGEGPRLVRELFKLADLHSPSIVFLDEIDAVGTKRFDTGCGGEREVQRTLLELLNQLDGFATHHNVKVIMATNRMDVLDPALIRPGRIDRKVHVPLPGPQQLKKIFQIQTERMNLTEEARAFEGLGWERKDLSGADVKAVCTEAGLLCLRQRLSRITRQHLDTALLSVLAHKSRIHHQHLYL